MSIPCDHFFWDPILYFLFPYILLVPTLWWRKMAVICREITTVGCFLSLRCTKWSPGALSGAPTPICFTAWMTNGPHDPKKSCWTGWKGSLLPWSIPVFSPKNDQLRWSQTYMAIEKQSRTFSSIPKWSVSNQKLPIDYEGFHCHPLADCIQDGSLLFVFQVPSCSL